MNVASDHRSDRPAFSIVTATFNSGALFERTRASIEGQTCRSFEWIVVDGGSSDDTLTRIRAAEGAISWWVSERDDGIADAWNKGIRRARGEYILILNAGDTYDVDFLSRLHSHCDGERIVCSHARLFTEDGRDVGIFKANPRKLRLAMHLPHNWCAVPARHYVALGLYEKLPLAMDFEWFHRYYKRYGVDGFIVVDAVLGTYFLGGASDARYAESFQANERILVQHGMNPFIARASMLSYRLKHALKYRLRRVVASPLK